MNVLKKEKKEQGKENVLRALISKPILLMFLLISLLNYFVFTQFTFSLPLQMNGLFGSKDGVVLYSTLVTINAVCVIVLTPLITAITKKWAAIISNVVGALLYAIGFGMLYYSQSVVPIMISTVLWTIGEILIQTNVYVYIAERSPVEYRARFNSLLLLIGIAGFALGPSMTGLFIRNYGVHLVWPMIFIISMVYAGLLYVLYGLERRKQVGVHCSEVGVSGDDGLSG
ncbi:Major Facilitator Superfamily protein [compost metagenome]